MPLQIMHESGWYSGSAHADEREIRHRTKSSRQLLHELNFSFSLKFLAIYWAVANGGDDGDGNGAPCLSPTAGSSVSNEVILFYLEFRINWATDLQIIVSNFLKWTFRWWLLMWPYYETFNWRWHFFSVRWATLDSCETIKTKCGFVFTTENFHFS